MAPPKRRVSRRGPRSIPTRQVAQGPVYEVINPIDLWYLCQKIEYAKKNPMRRSDGVPMYQRVVTRWIRFEAKTFGYKFPWAGEVGYDMTTNPPTPIMSRKEPQRPSEFPLSQYNRIRSTIGTIAHSVIDVEKPLVTKTELEIELIHPTKRMTGLMRIPDVINLSNFAMAGGIPKYSQGNISTVIEIKFEGDRLWEDQKRDYEKIAGNKFNLKLMDAKRCTNNRRRREWEEAADAKREPVFNAIREQVRRNSGVTARMSHGYQLIESLINEENQEVRRLFDDVVRLREQQEQRRLTRGHEMRAAPSREEMMRRERERQRAVAGMEMVLSGPIAITGLAIIGGTGLGFLGGAGATTTVTGTAATGGTVGTVTTLNVGRTALATGGRLVGNPALQRTAASVVAANSAVFNAAAQEYTEATMATNPYGNAYVNFLLHNPDTYESFYYWPDSNASYQITDYGILTR